MDWAPDHTPRVKVGYRSAGFDHHFMFRVGRGVSSATAASAIGTLASNLSLALATLLPADFAYTSFDFAPEDSEVFMPLGGVPSHTTGAQDVADYSPIKRAMRTTFKGKSLGSKVSVSIFGVFFNLDTAAGISGNGRVDASESAVITAAISALEAASAVVAVDNTHPSWYAYSTVKVDDHFLRIVRRTFP